MLHELLSELRRVPPLARGDEEMAALLGAGRVGGALPALPARGGCYTRTRAYGDERFEVLLLNWSRGAASHIHDHGGQRCWFVVLDGNLRVDDYARLDETSNDTHAVIESRGAFFLGPGDLDVRGGRFDIHRVTAASQAVTLHVYARPLREFGIYDYETQRRSTMHSGCDADISPAFQGGAFR